MADKQRALYRGDRSRFLDGIPARNLSESDWQALDDSQRDAVRTSDLYDVRSDSEMSGSTAARVVSKQPAAITGEPVAGADSKPADTSV